MSPQCKKCGSGDRAGRAAKGSSSPTGVCFAGGTSRGSELSRCRGLAPWVQGPADNRRRAWSLAGRATTAGNRLLSPQDKATFWNKRNHREGSKTPSLGQTSAVKLRSDPASPVARVWASRGCFVRPGRRTQAPFEAGVCSAPALRTWAAAAAAPGAAAPSAAGRCRWPRLCPEQNRRPATWRKRQQRALVTCSRFSASLQKRENTVSLCILAQTRVPAALGSAAGTHGSAGGEGSEDAGKRWGDPTFPALAALLPLAGRVWGCRRGPWGLES